MCWKGTFLFATFEGNITGDGFCVPAVACGGRKGEEYLLSASLLDGVPPGAGIVSGLSVPLLSRASQLGEADRAFPEIGLLSPPIQLGGEDLAFSDTGLALFCEGNPEIGILEVDPETC
mmetsp:Transcript_60866/g.91919  ORF Transcript_60866/g.91919 Transcript_60866/m.91919 type:complete len:119 (-) Transcript_60866:1056-1412(-)